MQTCLPKNKIPKSYFNFSWFVTLLCDCNCWYCNVTKEPKFTSKETRNNILSKLKTFNNNFDVNILGGEPLTYPYLYDTIINLHDIANCNKINLLTNFKKDIDWTQYKEFDKLYVLISWHAQYVDDIDKWINRVLEFEKIGLNFGIRFIYSDVKQLEQFDYIQSKIPRITNRPVYQISKRQMVDDSQEVFLYNGIDYTYEELAKNNLTSFTGWTCENANKFMHIDCNGSFHTMCGYELIKDINNIENFDRVCKENLCICNMLFLLKKWKND